MSAIDDETITYAVDGGGAPVDGFGGWDPLPSGVGSEVTLERLVFVSLFSDAKLSDDLRPADGSDDRRGWWPDRYDGDDTGSLLWHLYGKAGTTAREVEDAIRASLQWMITDRVCSSIKVSATMTGRRVDVVLELVQRGKVERLPYPDLWSAYAR